MQIKSIHLGKNQRKHIREALKSGTLKAALIPIGATEQHNEHLAMEHDIASSFYLASHVAENLYPKILVTPPHLNRIIPTSHDAPRHFKLKGRNFNHDLTRHR